MEEWVPPAGLVTLITDLLGERGSIPSAPMDVFDCECPKCGTKTPARKFDPVQSHAEDLAELQTKHFALGQLIGAHALGVNVVGAKGF